MPQPYRGRQGRSAPPVGPRVVRDGFFLRVRAAAAALPAGDLETVEILSCAWARAGNGRWLGDTRYKPAAKVLLASCQHDWFGASILVAEGIVGNGREAVAAVTALKANGVRVVIAPGFAEEFADFCIECGIFPAVLARSDVAQVIDLIRDPGQRPLRVDLVGEHVKHGSGAHWPILIDDMERYRSLAT